MSNLTRISRKPRNALGFIVLVLIVGVSILAGLLVASPARADVGVHPILPGGSSIEPRGDTPIQMAAEKVVMTVRPATKADNALVKLNPQAYGFSTTSTWYPAVAEVQAEFTMLNPTGKPVSMTVWFPLASALEKLSWELNSDEIVPRIVKFAVKVGEKPIAYQVVELPNPKGADRPELPWASFQVTFPAEKKTLIHVSYLAPLIQTIKSRELALYYIFQTGAGWAGPIGRAELIVNLPFPASEETLTGLPYDRFDLPYIMPSGEPVSLPAGVVFEGNQARWSWDNFEPRPEDDFAILLIDLGLVQELKTARAAVQADSKNGRAWLKLAFVYHLLSTRGYYQMSVFSPYYLPRGLEAYQKAADLLEGHPVPHYGHALLTLTVYSGNLSPEAFKAVEEEYTTAQQLEAKNPSLLEEAGVSGAWMRDSLREYFDTAAIATEDAAPMSTQSAKETSWVATLKAPSATPTRMIILTVAATHKPTLTSTPTSQPTLTSTSSPTNTSLPSSTAQPSPTLIATQSAPAKIGGATLALIVAGGVLGLALVGFLVFTLVRRRGRK